MPSVEKFACKEGQKVLLIAVQSSQTKKLVEEVQCQVGSSGLVQLSLPELLGNLSSSTFDVVQFVGPINFPQVDLDNLLRILRPNGSVIVMCLALGSLGGSNTPVDQAQTSLKLNGFVQVKVQRLAAEAIRQVQSEHPGLVNTDTILCSAEAYKPAYEVGDSMPLKLAPDAVKAWTLNANDMFDDEIDVLDSDAVLDEVDLKKPDPSTLKAAACTVDSSDMAPQAKRKACKNCTCGLAEELEGETLKKPSDTAAAKSACGSCYLGDAFRCASCPYLGMPAFKPGEKVQLPVLSMDDDI